MLIRLTSFNIIWQIITLFKLEHLNNIVATRTFFSICNPTRQCFAPFIFKLTTIHYIIHDCTIIDLWTNAWCNAQRPCMQICITFLIVNNTLCFCQIIIYIINWYVASVTNLLFLKNIITKYIKFVIIN